MVERNTVNMDEEEPDSLDVFSQDASEDYLDSLEPNALLKEKYDVVVRIMFNILISYAQFAHRC